MFDERGRKVLGATLFVVGFISLVLGVWVALTASDMSGLVAVPLILVIGIPLVITGYGIYRCRSWSLYLLGISALILLTTSVALLMRAPYLRNPAWLLGALAIWMLAFLFRGRAQFIQAQQSEKSPSVTTGTAVFWFLITAIFVLCGAFGVIALLKIGYSLIVYPDRIDLNAALLLLVALSLTLFVIGIGLAGKKQWALKAALVAGIIGVALPILGLASLVFYSRFGNFPFYVGFYALPFGVLVLAFAMSANVRLLFGIPPKDTSTLQKS